MHIVLVLLLATTHHTLHWLSKWLNVQITFIPPIWMKCHSSAHQQLCPYYPNRICFHWIPTKTFHPRPSQALHHKDNSFLRDQLFHWGGGAEDMYIAVMHISESESNPEWFHFYLESESELESIIQRICLVPDQSGIISQSIPIPELESRIMHWSQYSK